MMLLVSEASEAHDVYCSRTRLVGDYEEVIGEELADIVIRDFSLCFGNGIDLEGAIIRRHAINIGHLEIERTTPSTVTEWVVLCGTLAQSKKINLTAIDQQMMLIVSDVVKAHDAYRNRTGLAGHYEEEISDRLAAIAISVFSFCFGNGLDLEAAIIRKHAINEGRPYLHGKDF